MKNNAKKLVALLLTVVMALSLMAVSVSADPITTFTVDKNEYYHDNCPERPATYQGEDYHTQWVNISAASYIDKKVGTDTAETGTSVVDDAKSYVTLEKLTSGNLSYSYSNTSPYNEYFDVTRSAPDHVSYAKGAWYQCTETFHTPKAPAQTHFGFKVTAIYVNEGDTVNVNGGTFDIYYIDDSTTSTTPTNNNVASTVNIYGGTHNVYIQKAGLKAILYVGDTADVTVKSDFDNNAEFKQVEVTGGTLDLGSANINNANGIALVVNGGTVKASGTSYTSQSSFVSKNSNALSISGGTVELTYVTLRDTDAHNGYNVVSSTGGALTLDYCNITGVGHEADSGTAAAEGSALYVSSADSKVTMTGGKITGSAEVNSSVHYYSQPIEINGCSYVVLDDVNVQSAGPVEKTITVGNTNTGYLTLKDTTVNDKNTNFANTAVSLAKGDLNIEGTTTIYAKKIGVDATASNYVKMGDNAAVAVYATDDDANDLYGVKLNGGAFTGTGSEVYVKRTLTADAKDVVDGKATYGIYAASGSNAFKVENMTIYAVSDDSTNTSPYYCDANTGDVYGIKVVSAESINIGAAGKPVAVYVKSSNYDLVSNHTESANAYGIASDAACQVTVNNTDVTVSGNRQNVGVAYGVKAAGNLYYCDGDTKVTFGNGGLSYSSSAYGLASGGDVTVYDAEISVDTPTSNYPSSVAYGIAANGSATVKDTKVVAVGTHAYGVYKSSTTTDKEVQLTNAVVGALGDYTMGVYTDVKTTVKGSAIYAQANDAWGVYAYDAAVYFIGDDSTVEVAGADHASGVRVDGVRVDGGELYIRNASEITTYSSEDHSSSHGVDAYGSTVEISDDATITAYAALYTGCNNDEYGTRVAKAYDAYDQATIGVLLCNSKLTMSKGTVSAAPYNGRLRSLLQDGERVSMTTKNGWYYGIYFDRSEGTISGGQVNAGTDGTNTYTVMNDSASRVFGIVENKRVSRYDSIARRGSVVITGGAITVKGDGSDTTRGIDVKYGTVEMLGGTVNVSTNNTDAVYVGSSNSKFIYGKGNSVDALGALGTEGNPYIHFTGAANANVKVFGIRTVKGNTRIFSGTVEILSQDGVAVAAQGGQTAVYAGLYNRAYNTTNALRFIAETNTVDGTALQVAGDAHWAVRGVGAKFVGKTALNLASGAETETMREFNNENGEVPSTAYALSGGWFVGDIKSTGTALDAFLYSNHYFRTADEAFNAVTDGTDKVTAASTTTGGVTVYTITGDAVVADAEWELRMVAEQSAAVCALTEYTLPVSVAFSTPQILGDDNHYTCLAVVENKAVTVTVPANIQLSGATDYVIVLGTNDKLTLNGAGIVSNSSNAADGVISSAGKLAVSGTVEVTAASDGKSVNVTDGELAISGGTFASPVTVSGGKLAVSGGTFNKLDVKTAVTKVDGNDAIVTGGTFSAVDTDKDHIFDLLNNKTDWASKNGNTTTVLYRTVEFDTIKTLGESGDTTYSVYSYADGEPTFALKETYGYMGKNTTKTLEPVLKVGDTEVSNSPMVVWSTSNSQIAAVSNTADTRGTVTMNVDLGEAEITGTNRYGKTATYQINTSRVPVGNNTTGGLGGATITKYGVTCSEGVSVNKTEAASGATVTIKVAEGYENAVVTDSNGKTVKLSGNTFTMPSAAVTVSVSKVGKTEEPTTTASFSDVAEKDWYKTAVDFVVAKGMMNGVSSDTFAPNASTTRGMIFTVLARLDGKTITSTGNTWFADGQAWAVEAGVSDGTNPTGNITREQLAAMLYRYATLKGYDVTAKAELTNSDAASVSSYATEAMQWAVGAKVVGGDENGLLNPTKGATRAEVATMLMRFCETVVK